MDDNDNFYTKFTIDLKNSQDKVLREMGVSILEVVYDNDLGVDFSCRVISRLKSLGYTSSQISAYK